MASLRLGSLTRPQRLLRGIPNVEFYSGFAVPMEAEVLRNPDDVFQNIPPTQFFMPVSETLWNIARQIQSDKNTTLLSGAVIGGQQPQGLGYEPRLVVSPDPGLSGSTFLDNGEYREALYRLFRAQAFEMEGAAFMHVCASAARECLVVRSLSDLAGGEAGPNEVRTFLDLSSENTAAVTRAIVSKLPRSR
ncbi:hypothetical protein PLESTF_000133500 [Pleodorina starrii]|nr:hypothetical protein PLESTF_000133500 [Pleodorina starrii]